MNIALHCKRDIQNQNTSLINLIEYIERCGEFKNIYISESLFEQLSQVQVLKQHPVFKDQIHKEWNIDFLFSLGGDGTLLECTTFITDQSTPIVCMNFGRLGFLSQMSTEDFEPMFVNLLNGEYSIEQRMVLQVEAEQLKFSHLNFALNEFAVTKRDTSSMMKINTWVDNRFLNAYWADGLIVSTPTGSTGYSLSVGGPIVMPELDNFIIAPICSHNLNVRPLVVSPHSNIKIQIAMSTVSFLASLDYRSFSIENTENVFFTVKKYPQKVQLVRFQGHDFFQTLRNKLFWGKDARN